MPAKPSNSRKFQRPTSGPRPGQFKRPSSPQMRAGSASGVKAERNSLLGCAIAFWVDTSKTRLALIAAAALMAMLYWPWVKFQIQADLRQDVCSIANASRNLSVILKANDPITAHDVETLGTIRMMGHHSLARRPILELPVLYRGTQVQLGDHPSVRRLVTQDHAQENLALETVKMLDQVSCDAEPPLSPHGLVLALLTPSEASTSDAPSLKPDHLKVAEVE